jgi:hypothetical protein
MKQQRLDHIQTIAKVTSIGVAPMSKRDRLLRWADLLMRSPDEPFNALPFVEFYDEPHQLRLRGDNTPMALAFADPILRDEGLRGDTLGDARSFFGLGRGDTHRLLCGCRYNGRMSGRSVAQRIRALAEPGLFGRLFAVFRG